MKEIKFKRDGMTAIIVVDDFGDGMLFKYSSTKRVYSMTTVGDPTATTVRNLIDKYANIK